MSVDSHACSRAQHTQPLTPLVASIGVGSTGAPGAVAAPSAAPQSSVRPPPPPTRADTLDAHHTHGRDLKRPPNAGRRWACSLGGCCARKFSRPCRVSAGTAAGEHWFVHHASDGQSKYMPLLRALARLLPCTLCLQMPSPGQPYGQPLPGGGGFPPPSQNGAMLGRPGLPPGQQPYPMRPPAAFPASAAMQGHPASMTPPPFAAAGAFQAPLAQRPQVRLVTWLVPARHAHAAPGSGASFWRPLVASTVYACLQLLSSIMLL